MSRRIEITDDLDIVTARVEARELAREIGFGVIDQARIATAISELARNVVLYAHSGEVVLSQIGKPGGVGPDGRVGLQIICRDYGPGIQNIQEIMNQLPAAASRGRSRSADSGLEAHNPTHEPKLPETDSAELSSGGNGAGPGAESPSGRGLVGTRRLMDEFEITSEVGVGTTVKACRWLRQGAGGDGRDQYRAGASDDLPCDESGPE